MPWGVPITFQVLLVLLTALILGPHKGAFSILIYVLLGAVGLPVFAGGQAGIGVILGPTGGYLIGFIVAAFIVGYIAKINSSNNLITLFMASIVGLLIIYVLGTIQFALVMKMSALKAITMAVLPYIPLDLVKVVIASSVAVAVLARLEETAPA